MRKIYASRFDKLVSKCSLPPRWRDRIRGIGDGVIDWSISSFDRRCRTRTQQWLHATVLGRSERRRTTRMSCYQMFSRNRYHVLITCWRDVAGIGLRNAGDVAKREVRTVITLAIISPRRLRRAGRLSGADSRRERRGEIGCFHATLDSGINGLLATPLKRGGVFRKGVGFSTRT